MRAPHRGAVLAAAAALLSLAASASGQTAGSARPPAGWSAFVQTFDAFTAADSIVGASTVFVLNGRVAVHHEVGSQDRALGQRVDERTIYHWASNTKTLTAIAIMQLRDHGRLSLDDHVTTWVPELRQIHDPFGSMDAITIRMLLSHSAGFQNPTWPYGAGKPWEPFEPTRWDQLVAMMPYQEIAFPPGSRYSYSNPAFIYLARIIEAITGDPLGDYVAKAVTGPLGMRDTAYWIENANPSGFHPGSPRKNRNPANEGWPEARVA